MTDTETIDTPLAAASLPAGRDVTIPLNKLVRSPNNVRKKGGEEGIPELAALIRSQGLLQRLSVTDAGGGLFAVEAGGRRLAACEWLRLNGFFREDQAIDCRLYAAEHAVAISMAENSGRLNMHPADEFEAFARLLSEGRTDKQVADQFGVSVLTVQRRMKLASLAPQFIQLFREGQVDMEQLQVLCLTDDHEQQVAAWDSLPEYRRSPYMLKQALINDEVEGDSRLAEFVGIDAYVAAGGAVRRDLFSASPDECWLQDGALVQQLAMARLEEAAEVERAAGWSWVEAHLTVEYSTMHSFERERPKARKMTDDEAQAMGEWQALADHARQLSTELDRECDRLDELNEPVSEEEKDAFYARFEEAEADAENIAEIVALLHALLAEWSPKQVSTCGVMVTMDHRGGIEVTRGLMRPQDRKAIVAELKKAGKPVPVHLQGSSPAKGERGVFSERLMYDLTAHRTAALQAALTDNAHVALALVVHKLAAPIFSTGYRGYVAGPLKISATLTSNTHLSTRASEYAESQAASVLDKAQALWGDRLPGGEGKASMLQWFIQQDDNTLMELLAFCSASALDAMHGRERTDTDDSDVLAEALGVDMADWWTPTPAKYLESVSKAQLTEAVTEACGAAVASPISVMKKADAVAYSGAKLEGTRWLPAPLRQKAAQAAQ